MTLVFQPSFVQRLENNSSSSLSSSVFKNTVNTSGINNLISKLQLITKDYEYRFKILLTIKEK